jgi:hypothetical protein
MKHLTLSIYFVGASFFLSGQLEYNLTFESPSLLGHVVIPQNSIWQIGSPQKTVFTTAYSPTTVIVTDRTNSYPVNDTSFFIIKNNAYAGFHCGCHTAMLSGNYFVNSDTLNDFGKIEFSPNNGASWIDLLNSTTYSSSIDWNGPKPTLTGKSEGWTHFEVSLLKLGPLFNIQEGDTVLYKFSFISDSVQNNKDGLMYDDFRFLDYIESVAEYQKENLISIFPNPASDHLTIKEFKKSSGATIELFDYAGNTVYVDRNFNGEIISTKNLTNGLYLLKYSALTSYDGKKIVIRH